MLQIEELALRRPKITQCSPLGTSIPSNTPHGKSLNFTVSVALPTWKDNVLYEEGDPVLHGQLKSGYPRFVYHRQIKQLITLCEKRFAKPEETCLVFPCRRAAEECREFINRRASADSPSSPTTQRIRLAELDLLMADDSHPLSGIPARLHIVLYSRTYASLAKQFWQHSGEGISSRFAQHALRVLEDSEAAAQQGPGVRGSGTNPRYRLGAYRVDAQVAAAQTADDVASARDEELFVEERFGRNLEVRDADNAKGLLRKRIAGIVGDLVVESESDDAKTDKNLDESHERKSLRGVTEDDVFLFPTGMSTIYNAHRLVMKIRPNLKSVQFGFPYLDTLKIQEKIGPGVHFLGFGSPADYQQLETLAKTESISALFCEFPSNPLLGSADLTRIRALANQYGFLIIVDETIGNFVNVDVLQHADVVVSSLTKVFSGDSNVMGGSLVLNPKGRYYAQLKDLLKTEYSDSLWVEDAVFLERNSRTFQHRIHIINQSAEALAGFLVNHPKVMNVFYPKYITTENYNACKLPAGGYGGLLSIVLHPQYSHVAFYDDLHCAKGPSLGTNFTLASPYTILAHYGELDWAEEYGVSRNLVRVSVGLEEENDLLQIFRSALDKA
ncbi:hypothetical protein SmJEL517_g05542 [Synchytrium microbalum]|uniref:Cystathionine gamma-synthase n=1 Tax=Synchytrium microbalum TaxID=1806994 RepID=A0A507BTW8_9FUNG|nr:uncharacterized protein SmJEL517_g05542 [Synchytrium microbalum]TPX31032.1 hypothetical protein SmJEL517_g05542 [Synchytrium microbalum]